MDMVQVLKDQFAGAIATQVASKLGIDVNLVKSAIGALLPTILGGLIKQASTKEGADALNETLDQNDFDGSLLDKLPGMLGDGGDTSQVTDLGAGLVKSLFGDKADMILGLISKLTGIKLESASKLLAMLAPIVMSFLGKQKQTMGLGSEGLQQLLMSQKGSVAKAIPAGMGAVMGFAELDSPATAPASGGGAGKVIVPLILIAAIAFAAYTVLTAKPATPLTPKAKSMEAESEVVVDDQGTVNETAIEDTAPADLP